MLYNIEAEKQVLGYLLTNPQGLPQFSKDFFSEENRPIYTAIKTIGRPCKATELKIINNNLNIDGLEQCAYSDYAVDIVKKARVIRKANGYIRPDVVNMFVDENGEFNSNFYKMNIGDIENTIVEKNSNLLNYTSQISQKGDYDNVFDLIGLEDEQKPIIKGLINENGIIKLVGSSKVGKTCFLHQLCFCLANQIPFLGHEVEKPIRSLVVDYESTRSAIGLKAERALKYYGLDKENAKGYITMFEHGKERPLEVVIEEIKRLIPELGIDFVWFDCYYQIAEGDENSAEDTKHNLKLFERLQHDMNIGVGYVHHDTKNGYGNKEINSGAGSNVHGRLVTNSITLGYSESTGLVTVKTTSRFDTIPDFTIIQRTTENGYAKEDSDGLFEVPTNPTVKKDKKGVNLTSEETKMLEELNKCFEEKDNWALSTLKKKFDNDILTVKWLNQRGFAFDRATNKVTKKV